jgi:hypothetical protein
MVVIRHKMYKGGDQLVDMFQIRVRVSVDCMKKWCCIIPILFSSACTTIEDFQAMSADERADKVCSATSAYRQRSSALANITNQISAKEELLATGYRVYEDCQVVPVSVPAKTADCSGTTGAELEACKRGNTPTTTEYRRVCRETPVPIDYNYESSVLRDLRMAREGQLEIHERQTEVCVAKARSLPATDAYSLYMNNAEP